MKQTNLLGPWVKRFLTEHLIQERSYSYNTQTSYRDTFCLLLPFIARCGSKSVDKIYVEDISQERVRAFLAELELKRHSSPLTRNQRLAAIRSIANYIGLHSPEHMEWATSIKIIPFKKTKRSEITYLEKEEMDALLNSPDRSTPLGRRDYALILFLYNTGARADEVANVKVSDLNLPHEPSKIMASVTMQGKGNKQRICPLWKQTAQEIMPLIKGRSSSDYVFLNRCNQPMTRFGIHSLVERYVKDASTRVPSLLKKRVSPHTIRHTTATHLLRSGVDINTIRAWLGHVSLNTTNIYAEIDLEMKASALANCEPQISLNAKPWKNNQQVMAFLRHL